MATTFHIRLHTRSTEGVEEAVDRAFQRARELNAVFSDYEPNSELNQIARVAPDWWEASPEMLDLSREAIRLAEATEGAFDPTCGNVTRLWRRSLRRAELPPEDRRQLALDLTDWRDLEIREDSIRLRRDGMLLDYGGIAKGHAADQMLASLTEDGFPIASVTAGGDVRVGQPPPGETGWRIQIRSHEGGHEETLRLAEAAVSTSGDLHQFVVIEGKRYSHIVSPRTGHGLKDSMSCTVIADSATESDALATALAVIGPEVGRGIAEELSVQVRWSWLEDGQEQQKWFPSQPNGTGAVEPVSPAPAR